MESISQEGGELASSEGAATPRSTFNYGQFSTGQREEDDEAAPGPVELESRCRAESEPTGKAGGEHKPASRARLAGPCAGAVCVHVWPPLTCDVGVDVLCGCALHLALTADTPNLSKHPSQAKCQH